MNDEAKRIALCALLGFTMGSCWYVWRQGKVLKKAIEQNNMKVQLINWMVSEGLELDRYEFVEEFMLRREFIKLTLHA